jgi:hypothetical protein
LAATRLATTGADGDASVKSFFVFAGEQSSTGGLFGLRDGCWVDIMTILLVAEGTDDSADY